MDLIWSGHMMLRDCTVWVGELCLVGRAWWFGHSGSCVWRLGGKKKL